MNLLAALSNVLLQLAKCYVRVQSPEEGWGFPQADPQISGALGSLGAPEGHRHGGDTATLRMSTSPQSCQLLSVLGEGAPFHSNSVSLGTQDCPRDAGLHGTPYQ